MDTDGGGSADGENAGVSVDDFERVRARLAAWCDDGVHVEERDGVRRAVCDFGRATFAVTADGQVDAGMPLHVFEGRAERLVFEADAVRVLGPDLSYVYRRP